MTVTIALTSDFICPWCLVAHAHLQKAIAQLREPIEVEWIWHPFELNPTMPTEGITRRTYRTNKFGSWAYSQQLDAQTVQIGQASGVEFRYDLMEMTPNTLKAHRLTWLASQSGKGHAMAERILNAYFTEGQDIGTVETLSILAAEVGLDGSSVREFLLSEEGTETVKALEREAFAQGVNSVPTIQIGDAVLVGGQPVEAFVTALQAATQKMEAV
ncbi:MAG: DsbA family oxidoreductase [Cyanobacteria bacterium J06626_18]